MCSEGGRWKSSDFSIRAFRAQISRFELFELFLLLKVDKQFPVQRFEASRATRGGSISVSSTANFQTKILMCACVCIYIYIYIMYIYIYIYNMPSGGGGQHKYCLTYGQFSN